MQYSDTFDLSVSDTYNPNTENIDPTFDPTVSDTFAPNRRSPHAEKFAPYSSENFDPTVSDTFNPKRQGPASGNFDPTVSDTFNPNRRGPEDQDSSSLYLSESIEDATQNDALSEATIPVCFDWILSFRGATSRLFRTLPRDASKWLSLKTGRLVLAMRFQLTSKSIQLL